MNDNTKIPLFLINVIREDGCVWEQCVSECSDTDEIVVEFYGPKEMIGKYFYISDIKYTNLDSDMNEDTIIIGNNKSW